MIRTCWGSKRGAFGVLPSVFRTIQGLPLFGAFGGDCTRLGPPPIPPYARAFYTKFSSVSVHSVVSVDSVVS